MSYRPDMLHQSEVRPSPELDARRAALSAEMGEEITLDALSGDWKLFQRRRGHRYSTDDLLTAWYAIKKANGTPRRMLDLGTGIGSVGLTCAWHFREALLTGVEAQEVSFKLLRENVWANGTEARVTIIHSDLRAITAGSLDVGPPFDLVSGSPPYFDIKKGVVAADSQKAHARFELRGDVRDYCLAAKRSLAPEGRFIFCFPTNQAERALAAVTAAGLHLRTMRDVIPRAELPALFSLFSCGHAPAEPVIEPPLVVRGSNGRRTDEMNAIRTDLAMPLTDRD